jgi:hypothetical protein
MFQLTATMGPESTSLEAPGIFPGRARSGRVSRRLQNAHELGRLKSISEDVSGVDG